MVAADSRAWRCRLPCPIVVREDDQGIEVAVLRPSYVAGLFTETDFGDAADAAEAEVIGIVDRAAS